MIKLSHEQQNILNLVSRFGCLDIEQAYYLLKSNPINISAILINMLIKNDYLELINEHILVGKGSKKMYDRDIINCIWVMLKIAKNESEIYDSMSAQAPAKIYFTINGKDSFELIPVNQSKLINIRTAQDKYIAKNEQFKGIANNWIVFVTDDLDVITKIKACNLQFPFLVACVGEIDEKTGIPNISLKKSIPKNKENA